MVKKLLSVLKGEPQSPPPVWLMRQAGRYLPEYRALRANAPDFVQFCLNPELAVEVTLQPVRRFGLDAAILFADILLVPHALGQKLWFAEGEGPRLDPIHDAAGIAALRYDAGKLAPVMQTIKGVRAAMAADPGMANAALIGFAGAPWTVATYMIEGKGGTDHENVRKLAWREPQTFARLMDVLVDATSQYLIAQGRCRGRSPATVRKLGQHSACRIVRGRCARPHRPHRRQRQSEASGPAHYRLSPRRGRLADPLCRGHRHRWHRHRPDDRYRSGEDTAAHRAAGQSRSHSSVAGRRGDARRSHDGWLRR